MLIVAQAYKFLVKFGYVFLGAHSGIGIEYSYKTLLFLMLLIYK